MLALFMLITVAAHTHYGKPPCRDDEVEGAGADGGIMCLTVGECPTDVPEGVTAKPECSDMGWCGLMCNEDSQCGKEGHCDPLYRQCTYPQSDVKSSSPVQFNSVAGSGCKDAFPPRKCDLSCRRDCCLKGGGADCIVLSCGCSDETPGSATCYEDALDVNGCADVPSVEAETHPMATVELETVPTKLNSADCSSRSEDDCSKTWMPGAPPPVQDCYWSGGCAYCAGSCEPIGVEAVSAVSAHYGKAPCASDDTQGHMSLWAPGYCNPACPTGSCPTDVPKGVSATPQCVSGGFPIWHYDHIGSGDHYWGCVLVCQTDAECGDAMCQKDIVIPNGSADARLFGVCAYPTPKEAEEKADIMVV